MHALLIHSCTNRMWIIWNYSCNSCIYTWSSVYIGFELGTFWFLIRHSYHWATEPRWQRSVRRWYFHRISFKFRLCLSPLKGWWDWAVLCCRTARCTTIAEALQAVPLSHGLTETVSLFSSLFSTSAFTKAIDNKLPIITCYSQY